VQYRTLWQSAGELRPPGRVRSPRPGRWPPRRAWA